MTIPHADRTKFVSDLTNEIDMDSSLRKQMVDAVRNISVVSNNGRYIFPVDGFLDSFLPYMDPETVTRVSKSLNDATSMTRGWY